jgi:hypothetical protein
VSLFFCLLLYTQLILLAEEQQIRPDTNEFGLIPIVQSSSRSNPRIIATVKDDPKWVKTKARNDAGTFVGNHDVPLVHTRAHKEFTKDVEAALNHKSSTVCPEIKNKVRLNEFLTKIHWSPILDDEEEEEEEDEEEDEEGERPHKRKRA